MPARIRTRFTKVIKKAEARGLLPKKAEELSVAFVSDEEMTQANRQFRKKNCPTDVLSFPNKVEFGEEDNSLGDIMIALDVAFRQAKEYGATLSVEVERLFAHGLLHLCGYDHHSVKERREMESLEEMLLGRDPYSC